MRYRRTREGGYGRRGVASTELAVVAPVFLFILIAATDFARVFADYLTVSSCARNGALYGSLDAVHATDFFGIQTAALADSATMVSPASASSSYGFDANGDPYVQVTVTATFTTL